MVELKSWHDELNDSVSWRVTAAIECVPLGLTSWRWDDELTIVWKGDGNWTCDAGLTSWRVDDGLKSWQQLIVDGGMTSWKVDSDWMCDAGLTRWRWDDELTMGMTSWRWSEKLTAIECVMLGWRVDDGYDELTMVWKVDSNLVCAAGVDELTMEWRVEKLTAIECVMLGWRVDTGLMSWRWDYELIDSFVSWQRLKGRCCWRVDGTKS